MLTELSWPLSIVSYTLFSLYWYEMMTTASVVVHPFMVKMKIPAFIISAVLVCLQITRTILRNVAVVDNFPTITGELFYLVRRRISDTSKYSLRLSHRMDSVACLLSRDWY